MGKKNDPLEHKVYYDIATQAMIFNGEDRVARRTALMYMLLMNTNDTRSVAEARKRIDNANKPINFTAQEYADAVQMGAGREFFAIKIPAGSPVTALMMTITEYIGKAALEYPETIVLTMRDEGRKQLKAMKR